MSKILPKKFWPKRKKKYSLKELETIYSLCWKTKKTSMGQIREAVTGSIVEEYSDQEIYRVLVNWNQKLLSD